ncbi:MAG: adenylate/guanylate cyclase domain-containing protein [Reyranellaceae bacterium]
MVEITNATSDIPAKREVAEHPAPTEARSGRRRFTVAIGLVLSLAFAGVTALSGVAVVVALLGSMRTTTGLLRERTDQLVKSVEMRLRDHLEPVRAQAIFLAQAIALQRLDPADGPLVEAWLTASLAGTPQVAAISYASADMKAVRAQRDDFGVTKIVRVDLTTIPGVAPRIARLREATGPYWGDLLWSLELGQPLVNLSVPVRRDGKFLGGVVSLVSIGQLSRVVSDLSAPPDSASFVLYDRDFVLAHPRLTDAGNLLLLPGQTLPRLEQVGDRAMTGMWTISRSDTRRLFGTDAEGVHVASVDGKDYVYVYREVGGFSDKPLMVGHYFPASELYDQVEALRNGAIAALAGLAVALVVGILLGRAISRPMVRLAAVADEIREFKFEGTPLPHSPLREINHANIAVNASREALHWFSTFVPRKLVTRLLAEGETSLQSKRREVTIMFTDIVGFTMEAEDLPEAETAEFLNEHFALLAACIEDHGGVIDKFIGDAVMATWGAIKRMPDHADSAMATALAIARALHEDNQRRRAAGRVPIRLRVGLHSGPVVVGNIGAPGRINYTVVGDTVNTAQRMEQLGKNYMAPQDEIVILVTGDTVAALQDRDAFAAVLNGPAERHEVRGRLEAIEVHRLRLPENPS